jgi:hypothetical protein
LTSMTGPEWLTTAVRWSGIGPFYNNLGPVVNDD